MSPHAKWFGVPHPSAAGVSQGRVFSAAVLTQAALLYLGVTLAYNPSSILLLANCYCVPQPGLDSKFSALDYSICCLLGASAEKIKLLKTCESVLECNDAAIRFLGSLASSDGKKIAADFPTFWLDALLTNACYLGDLMRSTLHQKDRDSV
jgi:hypothetical protein